jgi:hypothetical protein
VGKGDKYEVEAECIADTDNAILVATEHGETWIPKSQVDDDSEVYQKGRSPRLRR